MTRFGLALAFGALLCCSPAEEATLEVREYTQEEVLALLGQESSQDRPLLLDVRSPAEYASGHLPGAVNIPFDALPGRTEELAEYRDRGVITYCESGRRAALAENSLSAAGFRRLGELHGHMSGWRAAGLPTEHDRSKW